MPLRRVDVPTMAETHINGPIAAALMALLVVLNGTARAGAAHSQELLRSISWRA
jgi:hypothetical protein